MSDFFATVFVWFTTIILSNTSIYDPYWSVAPPVYFTIFFFNHFNFDLFSNDKTNEFAFSLLILIAQGCKLALLIIIWIWGIRLTLNWMTDFTSLARQDWRYSKFKDSCPFLIWHIINFFGLQLVPTIIVFLAMLPGYEIMNFTSDSIFLNTLHEHFINNQKITICSILNVNINTFAFINASLLLLGAFLSMIGIILEHYGDIQLREFRKNPENKGKVCNKGLWSYSRHPNYLGEIMMWWGVYIMASPILLLTSLQDGEQNNNSLNCSDNFLCKFDLGKYKNWPIGAIANTLLFLCVSIPLMEGRQLKNKPSYAEYKKKTGMLIPKLF